jgi:3-deoxy-manno-octulosonate cytidylyltransferase (CMP-KDO synthetase)
MNCIGIIPARFGATRFEGKVLANLLGKPVLQHVWEQAKKSKMLDDLIIACDDERIEKRCQEFGAKVVMTSKGHASGTDRLTEVVQPLDVKVIVNIQADEPLVHFTMIDDAARCLLENSDCVMATIIKAITEPSQLSDPNVVKVVKDKDGNALYFSRALIPFQRDKGPKAPVRYYKHIGLYSYTKDFLFTFKNLPPSLLEQAEKLEQLRVLEAGFKIRTLETGLDTVGVDTPEDLRRVEAILRNLK